jgi:hypothetical protein
MKDRNRVDKVEHVWSKKEDRWVYIEYNEQRKIIGLNFMQGDDYDYFKKSWCHNDQGLTGFYHQMLYTFPIEQASISSTAFIDKVMWAYHTAVAYRNENTQ